MGRKLYFGPSSGPGSATLSPCRGPRALDEDCRREIFVALVAARDNGLTRPRSREAVAERFEITVQLVMEIEVEGVDNGWPPL